MSHDAILAPTHPQASGVATGHPDAAQALGMKVAQLETELAAARRDIARLARMQPSARSSGPTPEQLRLQSQAWDRLLGTSSRAHGARQIYSGRAAVSKRSCLRRWCHGRCALV